MPNYTLLERLDYNNPVTVPLLSVVAGTATGINFTLSQISSAAFSGTVTISNPTVGTLFIYENGNKIFKTITFKTLDITSLTTVVNKILTPDATLYPFWSVTALGSVITFTCVAPYISSPSAYPYVQVVNKDSAYVYPSLTYPTATSQDELTSQVIRSQIDYVTVVDPITFLHSTMQNQFYKNLTFSVQQEWQNVIDLVNELKTLFNIDYYDGDSLAFLDKINAIFSLFGYNAPLSFIPYTNVENGDALDLTKQNDFVRNLAKRIWLQRRWAGTLVGYALLPKFLNRLGAVHIGVQYTTLVISKFTGKIYRLLDLSQLGFALPGSSSFPDSVNIVGAQNIRQVQATYPLWDTGLIWTETIPITNATIDTGGTGVTFSSVVQSGSYRSGNTFTFSVLTVCTVNGNITINGNIIPITTLTGDTLADIANVILTYFLSTTTSGFAVSVIPPATLVFTTSPFPLSYDAPIAYGLAQKALLIEIGLDRLLHHTNTIGSNLSLMDNAFLDAINYMVPNVRRARDQVYVGSQLTLVTGKDGSYNKLSQDSLYTHPNINALFQVMFYKPDKVTTAWSGALAVDHIKIGTGAWGSSVFVDSVGGQAPNDPGKVIPTDLVNPIFQTQIGAPEKTITGGFNFINTVIHPRSNVSGVPPTPSFIVNGTATLSNQQSTYLSLVDQYVADGSVTVGVTLDNAIPPLAISYGGTGVLISVVTLTSASYKLTVTQGSVTAAGNLSIASQSIAVLISRTALQIASDISLYFTSGLGVGTGWSVSNIGAVITMNYITLPFHQRIWVYEQYNPVQAVYDSSFKYQELNSLGTAYVDFSDQSLLQGYSVDPTYTVTSSNYFPTIQKKLFNLLPLTIADKYPTLNQGQVAKFTFDENTPTAFSDYSVNIVANPPILNGNVGSTTHSMSITTGVSELCYLYTAVNYASVATPSSTLNGLTALSVGVFYNINVTNFIDRGDCESATSPMVSGETIPVLSTCTWAQSTDFAHGGTHSYKFVKTNAVGVSASVYLANPINSSTMNGFIAGYTYTFGAWVYIPTAAGFSPNSLVSVQLEDWVAGVAQSTGTGALNGLYDQWQYITVTRTMRTNCTGADLRIRLDGLADINSYFYVDDVIVTSSNDRTDSVLVAKESYLGASKGWGLYLTTTNMSTGNYLTFTYEQTYSSLKWQAILTQAQTTGWHQVIVSFDGTNIPSFFIDGVPIAVQQLSPLPNLNIPPDPGFMSMLATPFLPGKFIFHNKPSLRIPFDSGANITGVIFSTPLQSTARQFVFTVLTGATATGTIMVGNVAINTIISGDTPTQIATRIANFTNNYWLATANGASVTLIFVSTGAGSDTSSNPLYIGGNPSGRDIFFGYLDEVAIYNRSLSSAEAMGSYISTPLKNAPLLSSTQNQQYTYIDHKNGYVVFKLQYNFIGPEGALAIAALPYSILSLPVVETYDVSVSDRNIGITEMGLFDATDTLVAYATFPPVIYNAANYHLAFNLLIQQ